MRKNSVAAIAILLFILLAGQQDSPVLKGEFNNFYEPPANTSTDEGNWHYTINSDSLNERYEYLVDKPQNTFRIVTLGSSWAFGHLVDTEDNYSEVLEDLLNEKLSCSDFDRFEVINLSVYGYDVRYMVERFKRRGVKYDADLVVILAKDDDIMKPLDFIKAGLDKYSLETGREPQFQESGQFVDELRDVRKGMIEEAKMALGEKEILDYELGALRELSEIHKRGLLFLLYSVNSEEKKFVEELAEKRKETYIYHKQALGDKEKNYYGSPNERGHEVFADELFEFISNELLCA